MKILCACLGDGLEGAINLMSRYTNCAPSLRDASSGRAARLTDSGASANLGFTATGAAGCQRNSNLDTDLPRDLRTIRYFRTAPWLMNW